MDWDKNGVVSPIEFKSYLAGLKKGEAINSEEVYAAFKEIDTDGSKNIQWEEFLVRKTKATSTTVYLGGKNRLQNSQVYLYTTTGIVAMVRST